MIGIGRQGAPVVVVNSTRIDISNARRVVLPANVDRYSVLGQRVTL